MQPDHGHLNALLHTAAANSEVLSLIGADFKTNWTRNRSDMADDLAAGLVEPGLSVAKVVLKNPVVIALVVFAAITLLVLGYKLWRSVSAGKLKTVMNGFHGRRLNCAEPLEVIVE